MKKEIVSFKKYHDFLESGHFPTLISSFLYFDISFMAWMSLGPLMIYMAKELHMPIEDKLTLVSIPAISGAVFRIPLGLCADWFGPKKTATFSQIFIIISVSLVYVFGLNTEGSIALFGVALGIAGASFAVALPQVGSWYPPTYQGLVMGIAGAGNVGVVIDTLFAPWIAENYGWRSVYGLLNILLLIVLAIYIIIAKDAPRISRRLSIKEYLNAIYDLDCRWFMFFYSITAGGFIGLSASLPLYFTSQFHLDGISAGLLTACCVAFGSTFRPVGGYIADKIGGAKALLIFFLIVCVCFFTVAFLPEQLVNLKVNNQTSIIENINTKYIAVILFSCGMLCLGMGNGAVFQLIPQRFSREIGVTTGLVGAAGSLGGFFLTKTLAVSKGYTNSYTYGFLLFCFFVLLGVIGVFLIRQRWRNTWGANSGANI